jgi:hypothetical protein
MAVFAPGVLAQNNPFVGTWKLKPAKSSKVTSETLTFQMVGDQRQFTLNGTWADGSPISIKYETPDKGGAGKILEGPFDAVSGKRIDENTYETSLMKGGKEIRTSCDCGLRSRVSSTMAPRHGRSPGHRPVPSAVPT